MKISGVQTGLIPWVIFITCAIVFTAEAADLPADATVEETAAYGVLEKHCGRCHQDGRLAEDRTGKTRPKPAAGFGDVLELRSLVQNQNRVDLQEVNKSKIVSVIGTQDQHIAGYDMPYDCGSDVSCYPTSADVESLKVWIASMAPKKEKQRELISLEAEIEGALAHLRQIPKHRQPTMRYISLRPQHNDNSLTKEAVQEHRAGTIKTLNALSSSPAIFTFDQADPQSILIPVMLPNVGWSAEIWERLESLYPYGIKSETDTNLQTLQQLTHTRIPIIRADWLAATATVAPLYYEVLGLPDTFQELERSLNIDTFQNIRDGRVARAGFQESRVSQNNRLIERHDLQGGFFWTSYDFAGSSDVQNFQKNPFGPKGTTNSQRVFEHDGGETIFTLPNGFHGYYLNTADGKRLDRGPTGIVRDYDYTHRTVEVINGISCLSCHVDGMNFNEDTTRGAALNDRSLTAAERQLAEEIYPGAEAVTTLLKKDQSAYFASLDDAGIGRQTRVGGLEPVRGLYVYHRDFRIDLTRAAAELGLSEESLKERAIFLEPHFVNIYRRLEQAPIARDEWELAFPAFLSALTDYQPIKPTIRTLNDGGLPDGEPANDGAVTASVQQLANTSDITAAPASGSAIHDRQLAFYSDKSHYGVGDEIILTVEPKKDCSLTLLNINAKGELCVLFPHPALDNAPLKAGSRFTYPPRGRMFFDVPGTESFQALCNTGKAALAAEKRKFPQVNCVTGGASQAREELDRYVQTEALVDLDAPLDKTDPVSSSGGSQFLHSHRIQVEVQP